MRKGQISMKRFRFVIGLSSSIFSVLLFAQTAPAPGSAELNQATFNSQWQQLLTNLKNCKSGVYTVANFSLYGATHQVAPEVYKIGGWSKDRCVVDIQQEPPKEKLHFPLPRLWPMDTSHLECNLSKNALNLFVGYTAKMLSTNLENHSHTTEFVLQGQVYKSCTAK